MILLPHFMRIIFCHAVNKLYFYRKFSGEREVCIYTTIKTGQFLSGIARNYYHYLLM